MPNVVSGNTIESAWGNAIRDRIVQRYASLAERTSLSPTPSDGDLSFFEDSGAVDIYYSGSWRPLGTQEVDGSVEVFGPVSHTTSFAAVATVTLTIPTYWTSWKAMAYATFFSGQSAAGLSNEYNIRIDGTSQQTLPVNSAVDTGEFAAIGGRRTGMTTTGARAVDLMGREGSGTGQSSRIFLYARAVRI
jgi:hypothetical protein